MADARTPPLSRLVSFSRDLPEDARGPWFTKRSAAWYLDFPSPDAFRKFADREGLVASYRGRIQVFTLRDLDNAIQQAGGSAAFKRSSR